MCLYARLRAKRNTSPVEWMSVRVSQLEAGRPSCDSMWLPWASCSWLFPLGEEAVEKEVQGSGNPFNVGGSLHMKKQTYSDTKDQRISHYFIGASGTNYSNELLLRSSSKCEHMSVNVCILGVWRLVNSCNPKDFCGPVSFR